MSESEKVSDSYRSNAGNDAQSVLSVKVDKQSVLDEGVGGHVTIPPPGRRLRV